jgi:hypothetical protein
VMRHATTLFRDPRLVTKLASENINYGRLGMPRSCVQSGRTLAPRWPHLLHRIRGPNEGTTASSGKVSTLTLVRWPHFVQVRSSECGPRLRLLPSVIGPVGLVSLAMLRN